VETIGDAYMVVSGAPTVSNAHAQNIANMALDMVASLDDFVAPAAGGNIHIRIGQSATNDAQCLLLLLVKITRNSSGDEIANVNFLYDDIVHVLQNTIDSCINSATDRRGGYMPERMFTKFSEITQCNGHYAVQGHSRSPILLPIESSYTTSY